MEKKSGTGFNRFFHALGWSIAGLRAALHHEKAFQQELILFCILTPVALFLGKDAVEWSLLIGSLFFVLIVELLNSAVEAIVDRISEEHHPLAGRAKDMGSAAVFLSLVNVFVIWTFIILIR